MARVKTFRIHPKFGVPDKEVAEFLTECEKEMVITVTTEVIPGNPGFEIDNRLTVIVTKLDDLPLGDSPVNAQFIEKIS